MHQRQYSSIAASHSLRWKALARAALVTVVVAIGGIVVQSPVHAALCAGSASCSSGGALFSQATLDGSPSIGAPTGTNTGPGTSVTLGACSGNGVPLVDATYGLICISGQIPLFSGDPYAGLSYPSFGRQAATGNPWPFGVTVGGTGVTQTYRPPATTPVGGNTPAISNSLALQPAGAPMTSLSVAQSHPANLTSSVANANLPGTVPPVGSASSSYFAAQNNASSSGSSSGSSNGQVVCGSGPALTVTASPSSPVTAGQSVTISATAPTGASSPQFLFKVLSSGAWKDLQQDWSNSASYTLETSGYAPGTYDVLVWERDSANASNPALSPYAAYGGVQVTVTGSGSDASSSQDPPSVLPDVNYQGTTFPVNAQCL